ncbi:MAG: site-2 protease family protein [Turicibacter sp.]|nr:site-2 protease family protein [Turicibacter sp.]
MTLEIIIFRIPAAFIALVLHEMVKARVSTMLGDPTPKNSGFLSGKPLKYLDPLGFIVGVMFGFGWGQPTPTSPVYYKDRKKGILITFLTPSLVNLLTGLLAALLAGLLNIAAAGLVQNLQIDAIAIWVLQFIIVFARFSIATAIFNMIPVPPLDAAKILQALVSPNVAIKITQNEKLLQIILIMLIVVGVIPSMIGAITTFIIGAVL